MQSLFCLFRINKVIIRKSCNFFYIIIRQPLNAKKSALILIDRPNHLYNNQTLATSYISTF
jgi:hypothetical protein